MEWTPIDAVNTLINLTKLGVFEYKSESIAYVTPIENYFNCLENEGLYKKIESKKEAEDFVRRNIVQAPVRILRGISNNYGRSTDTTLVAAAFDIRNSSWCCAFSYWGECSEVKTFNWCSSNSNVSNTLPASLLLNPDKSFKAFGYEAQEQYGRLGDVSRAGYYFFQEVMSVFDSQKAINRHTIQKDVAGKEIETTTVFERTFNFLLAHFTRSITGKNRRITDSTETDAKYVIVLPTYFSENEQQFVYETAVKSGFPQSSLIIVLETEAAFCYYQFKVTKGHIKEKEARVGKKYLVACLGEETSTLSVNKKSDDGSSYEILKISKGSWGMKSILYEFETCLEELIGKQQIQAIKRDLSSEYNYLIEEFERKLKTIHDVQKLLIRIPFNILQWVKDHTLSSMEETINCSEYSINIKMACDKMILSKNL